MNAISQFPPDYLFAINSWRDKNMSIPMAMILNRSTMDWALDYLKANWLYRHTKEYFIRLG